MELMEEDVKAADLVRGQESARQHASMLPSSAGWSEQGCEVSVRRAPACVLTPEPCTLPAAAVQVLWVGISFQQSASTVYFRKVRCWIQVSAALVLCGSQLAAGGGCSRPAVGCSGTLAHALVTHSYHCSCHGSSCTMLLALRTTALCHSAGPEHCCSLFLAARRRLGGWASLSRR